MRSIVDAWTTDINIAKNGDGLPRCNGGESKENENKSGRKEAVVEL
jgi:hypothetical protein